MYFEKKDDVMDHMPVFIAFQVVSTNRGEYFIKSFRYQSKECLDRFQGSRINFANTYEVRNDINNIVCLFQENLYEVYSSCCPIRKKKVSRNRYSNRG